MKLADIATAFLHAVLDESERVYITPLRDADGQPGCGTGGRQGAAEAKLIQSVLAEMNVDATIKVCSDSSSAVYSHHKARLRAHEAHTRASVVVAGRGQGGQDQH